jgi:hypothetical protein
MKRNFSVGLENVRAGISRTPQCDDYHVIASECKERRNGLLVAAYLARRERASDRRKLERFLV